jgi:hypothetical protein
LERLHSAIREGKSNVKLLRFVWVSLALFASLVDTSALTLASAGTAGSNGSALPIQTRRAEALNLAFLGAGEADQSAIGAPDVRLQAGLHYDAGCPCITTDDLNEAVGLLAAIAAYDVSSVPTIPIVSEPCGWSVAKVGFSAAEGTATQLEFDFASQLSGKPAIQWPANGGFAGNSASATLVPGTTVDRFGIASGSYVSPTGTPFIQRSLAPGTQYAPYNIYNVLKPIQVDAGEIAPAFGMPGGGMQYKLPSSVQSLIDSGHLGIGH